MEIYHVNDVYNYSIKKSPQHVQFEPLTKTS